MPVRPRLILSPKHEAEIVSLYVDGLYTCGEIAADIGISPTTVRRILKANGVKMRRGSGAVKQQLPAREVERMIWLHEQGLSHAQMAEILGISMSAIRDRLNVSRKRTGRPASRQGCWGRRGEPKTIPVHVKRTVERWRAEDGN